MLSVVPVTDPTTSPISSPRVRAKTTRGVREVAQFTHDTTKESSDLVTAVKQKRSRSISGGLEIEDRDTIQTEEEDNTVKLRNLTPTKPEMKTRRSLNLNLSLPSLPTGSGASKNIIF